jgi:hypothetical protein
MDTDAPVVKKSSYQNLMEGNCEIVLKNEKSGEQLGVTELLRDLYNKQYTLGAQVAKIQALADQVNN